MTPLDNARTALSKFWDSKIFPGGIHAVSFQPTPNRTNEDRYIVQEWNVISGSDPWIFLAVLDGHGGCETVDYVQNNLPTYLQSALHAKLTCSEKWSPDEISNILRVRLERFDRGIGNAVKTLIPKPEELEESAIQTLVEMDETGSQILRRANAGTTLAAVLIDGNKNHLWAIGLGDSSIDGKQTGERLLALHNTFTPSEYARVKLSHPSWEPNVIKDGRVLGVLGVTREDPATVLGSLLSEPIDHAFLASVFDHQVEPTSSVGSDGNRATEILVNILGGQDAERLMEVIDPRVHMEDEIRI
ncbi:hypothetical protein H0H81_010938 [Sphagnurus paluster]|uniref:PPM-type phosphatase domain-containing protein n=1 Tax=Sphagnurus paluster TaxID=117069 RepID=A0A9P7FQQ6_9AGAR|nr:hypothetical protein H0H81_010938 [Sphagnurus paluster]